MRIAIVGLFILSSFSLILAGSGIFSSPSLPSFDEVKGQHQSSDLYLLDSQGRLIHQWRQDNSHRSFQWVALGDVSPVLLNAILKSEDKDFYSHSGVSWSALAVSLYQRIFKSSSRGGSTISMQLVKLIGERKIYDGWGGKVRQIVSSMKLERRWSKSEILEAYVNLVPLRGEHKGVASFSWTFFNKRPSDLTHKEATALSVLIRSPNAGSLEWKKRSCWQEPSLCHEMNDFIAGLNSGKTLPRDQQIALHLAQRLSPLQKSGEVNTTLRRDLQLYVQEVARSQIMNLRNFNVHDAAVIVIENATGEVWSYVGGVDSAERKYVDGIRSFRQAGSTLKPFLYATAFEKNILTENSWIEDSAVDIVFESGIYKPQNHDRQFYGWVQAKVALGSSLNVPAVKVFKLLNNDSFWEKLRALGFRNLKDPKHYGPALALGVADITLEDLAQAYRTMANGGVYSPLKFVKDSFVSASHKVFDENAVQQVIGILSQAQNRSLGFGLDSSLSVPNTAVKTGTSKDMRDNWCVGFNSRFTVGVWVGNFSGEPMWNVMGVTGAAPIWKKTMEWLQQNYPATPLYRQPTLSDKTSSPQVYPQARIVYPQDGMIMALDPAIPVTHQKMPLLAEGPHPQALSWKINGKKIAADRTVLWTPSPGRHTFELYQNQVLSQKVQVLVK